MKSTLPALTQKRVASLFVDPQKGFTPLCPAELPVPGGADIVPALMEIHACTQIHTCSSDAHHPSALFATDDPKKAFSPLPYPNTDRAFPRHCEVGTPGAELLDGLPGVLSYDYFVWKGIDPSLHPYSACYHDLAGTLSTGLIEVLRAKGVTAVVVGGLATDHCVAASVFHLCEAGFAVALYLPACRGVSVADTREKCKNMQAAGAVMLNTLAELKAWTTLFSQHDAAESNV